MERIWSPWRSKYISSNIDKTDLSSENCFLCAVTDAVNNFSNLKDTEREQVSNDLLIVGVREKCIIVLNKYPYNSGHTLIAPKRHIADFEELTADELISIMQTSQEVISAMKKLFNPHGFNIGVNVGQSAGAGLPGHIHFHIVPRWNGDSNFTSTIADIKVISTDIEDTRRQLAKELEIKNNH